MNSLSSSSLIPKFHLRNPLSPKKLPSPFLNFLRFSPLGSARNFNPKVAKGIRFNGPMVEMGDLGKMEEGELVVETSVTRTLPAALTLERGLESIKEAVEELKRNPPSSSQGIIRFQVAVPPSAKALNWFCCQPESSDVFPLFFLSKDTDNPTCISLYSNKIRGVFGIGVAISFVHSSSHASREGNLVKRYLSNDSALITAYGFMDINFDRESLMTMKHDAGCFYFFIPQIELHEHEGVSILAATLAWDDAVSCAFEQAICSYESSHHQASCFWPTPERSHFKSAKSAIRKLGGMNLMADKTIKMVCTDALSLARREMWAGPREQRAASAFSQFSFRLSQSFVIANNMVMTAGEFKSVMLFSSAAITTRRCHEQTYPPLIMPLSLHPSTSVFDILVAL